MKLLACALCASLLLPVTALVGKETGIMISNDLITLSFSNASGFPVTSLGPVSRKSNRIVVSDPKNSPLWSIQYVTRRTKTPLTVTSADSATTHTQSFISNNNSLTLLWSKAKLQAGGEIDVQLEIALLPGSPLSQWRLSVVNNNPSADVGLWTIRLGLGGLQVDPDSSIFFPSGFGTLYSNPAVSLPANGKSNTYPSSSACMQHLALGGEGSSKERGCSGVYFAAHVSTSLCFVHPVLTLCTLPNRMGWAGRKNCLFRSPEQQTTRQRRQRQRQRQQRQQRQ
jgi:hypothetical protein